MSGTNAGESQTISGYAASTGTFTVDTAFTNPIDSTSRYLLIAPIPRYVKYAQIEQALYLSQSTEIAKYSDWKAAGIVSRSIGDTSIRFRTTPSSMDRFGGQVSAHAYRYLQRYIDRNVSTGRS
jgi:hypothetical protein